MQPRQEGDLAFFPVTPHADGVTALRHADSALRLGEVPENVNPKDFVRRGHTLRADPETQLKVHIRKGSRAGPPVRTFGTEFSEHSHEAARKLREEIRRGVASGAIQRAGASCGAGEKELEAGMSGSATPPSALSLVTGPRPHAEVVLESEGVRGNLSGATALSRLLATRAGAPTSAAPASEHHFYFGGTRAQKRRLARRAENMAKAREANLALRKDELLQGNVAELERLSEEFEEQRRAELEAAAAAAREEQLAAQLEAEMIARMAQNQQHHNAARAGDDGDAVPRAPAEYSTPLAWIVLGGLALALGGVAVFGIRRAKGRSAR